MNILRLILLFPCHHKSCDSPGALQSVPPGLSGRGLVQVRDEEAAQLHGRAGDQRLDVELLSC